MVVSDTSKPSIRSSPWMRGAPQLGLSATIRKINSRICLEILRPPPTGFRTLQSMAQYSLNPDRCQRATVSGRTIKECLFPLGPEPASYDPEKLVDGSQPWPRLLALKDGELLAKGEVFEHQTAARPKPAKHGSEPEPKQVKHGNQVIADRLCRRPCEVVDFKAGQDCDKGQFSSGSLRCLGNANLVADIRSRAGLASFAIVFPPREHPRRLNGPGILG